MDSVKYMGQLAKALEQSRLQVNPYFRISEELAKTTRAMWEPYRNALRLQNAALRSFKIQTFDLSDIVKSCQWNQSIAQLLKAQTESWRMLVEPISRMQKELSATMRALTEGGIAWNKGIRDIISPAISKALAAHRTDFALRIVEPFRVFTQFSEKTKRLIEECSSDVAISALESSVSLASAELLSATDTIRSIAGEPADDEPLMEGAVGGLNLPDVQQQELLSLGRMLDSNDVVDLVEHSQAATSTLLVRMVQQLIGQCNEASLIATGTEVFKTTTRFFTAGTDLVWVVPAELARFAHFVDCLYFMFYEGSGECNRLLATKGGVLQDEECRFVWCVKFLRSKWLRHDPNHGNENKIRKSWEDVGTQLKWLGLGHLPVKEGDFRFLHRCLLEEAKNFLQCLLDRITSSNREL